MSEVKVNKVSPRSGTTVTIGDSGDTINLVGTLQNNGSPLTGDISSVVAGTGLSGGATSGVATLNIEAAQPTITSLGTITSFRSTGIDDNSNALAMTIASGKNVSIGTTQDQAKLQVTTASSGVTVNGNADELFVEGSSNAGITIGCGTSGAGQLCFGDSGDNDVGALAYLHDVNAMRFTTSGTEKMRINSSGKVSIGTSTAEGVLRITNATQTSETLLTLEDTGGTGAHSQIVLKNTTGIVASILTTSDNLEFRVDDATVFANISGTEHMRIKSSGLVGIGTSAPELPLSVVGLDTQIHFSEAADGGGYLMSEADSQFRISGGAGFKVGGSGWVAKATEAAIIGHDSGGDIKFFSNTSLTAGNVFTPTERMRLDSSGRLGIGTTTPSNYYTDKLVINAGSTQDGMTIVSTTSGSGMISFADGTSGDDRYRGYINYNHTSNFMDFAANAATAMRINSSGFLIIGANSIPTSGTTVDGVQFKGGSDTNFLSVSGNGGQEQLRFINPNGRVGSIRTDGSSTTYNTSSDYRLKENVVEIEDATTRLKQLKPKRFNFIADANKTVDGFLAHEVSSVIPEAISGTKDETETKEKVVVDSDGHVIGENIEQADWETGKIADEDSNTQYPIDSTWEATKVVPVYQGIDQSKLVPLLVKTIQELEARITTLENA